MGGLEGVPGGAKIQINTQVRYSEINNNAWIKGVNPTVNRNELKLISIKQAA